MTPPPPPANHHKPREIAADETTPAPVADTLVRSITRSKDPVVVLLGIALTLALGGGGLGMFGNSAGQDVLKSNQETMRIELVDIKRRLDRLEEKIDKMNETLWSRRVGSAPGQPLPVVDFTNAAAWAGAVGGGEDS